jgi:hypothetical protein
MNESFHLFPEPSNTIRTNTSILPISIFTVASTKSKLNVGKWERSFVKYRYTEMREHPQFIDNAAFPVGQAVIAPRRFRLQQLRQDHIPTR